MRFLLAQFYFQEGNFLSARDELNLILQKTPSNIQVRLLHIRASMELKEYENAMTIAKQGILLSPNNPELLKVKRDILAAQNANFYATSNPQTPKSDTLESETLKQLYTDGKHQQAIDEAKNYLHTNPNDLEVRYVLLSFTFKKKTIPWLVNNSLLP